MDEDEALDGKPAVGGGSGVLYLTGHAGPTANELYVLPQTNRSLLTTDVAGNVRMRCRYR